MVSISVLARMLAGQMGMEVVWDRHATTFAIGRKADGKIVLFLSPALAGVEAGDVQQMNTMLRGALAHECVGHGRFTDLAAPQGETPYIQSVANILEDIRIEGLAPTVFPGARRILADMVEELERRAFWAPAPASTPENAIGLWILRTLRAECLGQPMRADWTDEFRRQAVAAFGEDTCEACLALARQAPDAPDTASVIELARQIVDLLRKQGKSVPGEQEQEQSASAAGKQSADPQNGEDAAEQGGESEQQSGASGDAGPDEGRGNETAEPKLEEGRKEEEGNQSPGRADPGAQAQSSPGREALDENVEVDASPEDFVKREIRGGGVDNRVLTIAHTHEPIYLPNLPQPAINPLTHRLREELRQHLRAMVEDQEDAATDRGRLDMSRIVPALCGREMPFSEEGDIAPGLNTAMELMVDCSSSMHHIEDFAGMMMLAVADACQEFHGLDLTVSMFGDDRYLLRKAHQPWRRMRPSAKQAYGASGGTQWPACASAAIADLALSRRPRKLLLTVTDGDLGDYQSVVETARHLGVELAFVGIDCQSPDPSLAYHACESSKPQTMTHAVSAAIRGAMRHQVF